MFLPMGDQHALSDATPDVEPSERPPKVRVAAAILVISGTLIPVIAAIALGLMAAAYGPVGSGAPPAVLVAPSLLAGGCGGYLALSLYRGDAWAPWASVGFLLLIAATSAGAWADGKVNPVSFMTVVALVGIVPLFDPAVRTWCRFGARPMTVGIARLTALVGAEMVFAGLTLMVARVHVPVAAVQVVIGLALAGLAIPLHNGAPGVWVLVSALFLVQPMVHLGLERASERAAMLSAGGRLVLGGYVVFTLIYATCRESPADEEKATSG